MKCPRCHDRLELEILGRPTGESLGPYRSLISLTPENQPVRLDTCERCGGTWFDAGETLAVARLQGRADDWADGFAVLEMEDYLRLDCPRCAVAMTKVRSLSNRKIYYDVCAGCRGMWFDTHEVRLLLAAAEDMSRLDR